MQRLLLQAFMAVTALLLPMAASAQFRYGVAAGANFTDLSFKQDLVTTGMQVGPTAGLQCEFIFTDFGLGIDFGLAYSMTGARVNLGDKPIWSLDGFGRERTLMHNLQIPLHIRFKWTKMQGLEEIIAPIVYGGPEFNIQLANSRNSSDGVKAYKFSGGDVSLGCGLGVELLQRWQVTAGYTWGMTYALRTRLLENFSARCSGWNVKVAYMF